MIEDVYLRTVAAIGSVDQGPLETAGSGTTASLLVFVPNVRISAQITPRYRF
jgi:hypothetical protein